MKRYKLIKDIVTPTYGCHANQLGYYDGYRYFFKTYYGGDYFNHVYKNNDLVVNFTIAEILNGLGEWFEEIKEEEPEYVYIDGKAYIIESRIGTKEKPIRMIVREAKNYFDAESRIKELEKKLWSDNDMIEFADAALKRWDRQACDIIREERDENIMRGHLETYKNKKR